MKAAFALVLVTHGLIHFIGVAKAFRLAELPQLTRSISPMLGTLWLLAALLFLAAAYSWYLWPRGWWGVAAVAVGVSMAVVVPSWPDAKFGALVNAIVAIAVIQHASGVYPASWRDA